MKIGKPIKISIESPDWGVDSNETIICNIKIDDVFKSYMDANFHAGKKADILFMEHYQLIYLNLFLAINLGFDT